jgi:hypothetical protein
LPVPVTQTPAQVLPVIRGPIVAGSGRTCGHDVARATPHALDRDRVGAVEPEGVQRASGSMIISLAQAVLEGDLLGVDPARHEQHFFVLDVTHSTGPMPSGKSKTSGSLNGGRCEPASGPFSQITGGLRHSSMIVHIEKPGAKTSLPSRPDDEVGAIAGAEFVDLAEQVVGGIAREDVGQPGLDADADQGEPARSASHSSPARTARRRA